MVGICLYRREDGVVEGTGMHDASEQREVKEI
jgi:hypothetical protein